MFVFSSCLKLFLRLLPPPEKDEGSEPVFLDFFAQIDGGSGN